MGVIEVIEVEEVDTKIDGVADTMIEDRAVRTTSPSAAETGIAIEMVGMAVEAEMTAHESAATRATATTTRDNEGDTRPFRRVECLARVCERLPPFSSPNPFSSMRVRSDLFIS